MSIREGTQFCSRTSQVFRLSKCTLKDRDKVSRDQHYLQEQLLNSHPLNESIFQGYKAIPDIQVVVIAARNINTISSDMNSPVLCPYAN
jgi:hypothetical protein